MDLLGREDPSRCAPNTSNGVVTRLGLGKLKKGGVHVQRPLAFLLEPVKVPSHVRFGGIRREKLFPSQCGSVERYRRIGCGQAFQSPGVQRVGLALSAP